MNTIVNFKWFIVFLSCMCNFKSIFSEEPVPVHFKGKYTSDIRNYEIVVPQRVNKDGNFISHLVSHHHSKRSTTELEFIFYKIPIGGKDYLIELTPNRKLISPGAVVEIHKEDVRRSTDRKFSNNSINNENVTKMFRNLDIKKLENTDCHFFGHVKGENTSKAALSTCYGLAGFIQIHKGIYTIEPVAEHNPFLEGAYPHILYKADGLDNSSVCHTIGGPAASVVDGLVRKRRESNFGSSTPTFIETLIVMDKTFINYYQDSDCENYVLTVFNMAFNLFRDASSGLMTTLTLVRLIRLEIENDEMNLKLNSDAEDSLRYFQNWQDQINPGDDSHPNHHDVALLVTKVDVCYSPSACGLLGLTTIGKGCDPKFSAALCEDNGLRLGYVIAHEIGHLLGADHDFINSTCNGTDAEGLKTVMHPYISTTTQSWSTCSQAYFKEFFSSGKGYCFYDEPEEHHFNVQDLLPGVMYNANFQCKQLITVGAKECYMGSTCDSLNCHVPGYACIITHNPPADGTHCGENMWCREGKCLVVGERPRAVDGNWGDWSPWSDCSRSCGSGVASSTRNCDRPQPSHGGKNCVDLIRFISEEVNVSFVGKPCQTGRPSFRDIQCGEFDDWIYPEDGKTHSWKSYFFHDDNPCVLYCINEMKQVVALRPRVVDGTMCFRGIRDICISGVCKSLPCDLQFDSNAVEDACGVCHGDGTNCEFSEGRETFSKLTKGLSKLVNVPSGSRNIKVEELSPTSANIVVRDKDTKEIYVRGNSLGMFSVPGSQAWLGMIKKNQEALNIPGPVTKPLSIWIERLDNVTVKWSMALPAEQQRKPEFTWDFLKWGPCSAICGPGTQTSEPSCMEEKAGLVESSFCADLEMPAVKVRQCEVTKCQSRWMVGDWKNCDPQKKQKKRVVYCIKPIGEGEGESQIVPDFECTDPKPHDSQPCENRQKREDPEYNFSENSLEPDSVPYKPDNSEFGFHKKYEVYLKHFAALSVPQRNSETIPYHLVSSPHFKHYFHVLETPKDPQTDVSLQSVTSPELDAHTNVSPEFLTETFSGQRTSVTRVHSLPQGSKNPLVHRIKKNMNADFKQSLNPTLNYKERRIKKLPQMLHTTDEGSKQRQHSKRFPGQKRRRRILFSKPPDSLLDLELKPELKSKRKFKKSFNRSFQNLSDVFKNLKENEKSRCRTHNSKTLMLPNVEKEQLKSFDWGGYKHNPQNFSRKFNNFLSSFTKNKATPEQNIEISESKSLNLPVKPNNKDYDGSGLKKLSLTESGFHENVENSDIQDFLKKGRTFDFLRAGGFDSHSRKIFEGRHLALEDLLQDKRNKKYHRRKKFLKHKSTTKEKLVEKYKTQRVYKRKRSNRIWKKPKSKDGNLKSGKEPPGTCSGTETKNYLNNLFRDNHPKIFNTKPTQPTRPQELIHKYEKPVIREGALVIDHDLPENQVMEIFLEEEEMEPKSKKYSALPQPNSNERRVVVTGQDVFKLLRKIQNRPSRGASESTAAFYNKDSTAEENKSKPGTAKAEEGKKPEPAKTEEERKSEPAKAEEGKKPEPAKAEEGKKPEPAKAEEENRSSTSMNSSVTQTTSTTTIPNTTATQTKTTNQTQATTEATKASSSSGNETTYTTATQTTEIRKTAKPTNTSESTTQGITTTENSDDVYGCDLDLRDGVLDAAKKKKKYEKKKKVEDNLENYFFYVD